MLVKRIIFIILLMFIPLVNVNGYVNTHNDTKEEPAKYEYTDIDFKEYGLLLENENFKFYFRDDRDILSVYDKANGFTWKSGLDIEFSKDVKRACRDAYKDDTLTEQMRLEICRPIEDRLNTTYTSMANSLVTVEYFDQTMKIKRISSAAYDGAESDLKKVDDNHYSLLIDFKEIDVEMIAHIYLSEKGFDIEINDADITGDGVSSIASVMLNPFMGASGGQVNIWDPVEEKYSIEERKELIPGYVLVPDGSGALIRFDDYSTALEEYVGDIYSKDLGQTKYDTIYEPEYVDFKDPSMPLYGISYGKSQAAFLGYATKGSEYMQVVVTPEENTTFYTWAYPKFVYNMSYYQVYNQSGAGFFTTMDERNHFDIYMNYEFLNNDNYQANYVGMANAYRDYLLDEKILTEQNNVGDIPIRLDFLMADSKESILGYKNVYMTNSSDVDYILNDLITGGIDNISAGLYGWQDGGVSTQSPYKADFHRKIGTRKDFDELFNKYNDLDISFISDFVNINKEQVRIRSNAAKHVNGQYIKRELVWENINEYYVTSLKKTYNWAQDQLEDLEKIDMNSFTFTGLSNTLFSDYRYDTSVSDAIDVYQTLLEELEYEINLYQPNNYLWKYTDRYLQAPVYATQHLIETDTVPFLQLVLNNTMDVFAPYSNFSFSKQVDILRMIDYNVNPSFILTKESAYKLASTNSSKYYSTEYSNYKDIINKVYFEINEALSEVQGATWINREVLSPGVILNTYDNGTKIVINYTESNYTYDGNLIDKQSFKVII